MNTPKKIASLNVFGEPLEVCGDQPKTGFFRDGRCNTCAEDVGNHTICARMTREFLSFSKDKGNDLSNPRPEFNFPGLKPGDLWCLCANRWVEASKEGVAPRVFLARTHARVLDLITLDELRLHALDLN